MVSVLAYRFNRSPRNPSTVICKTSLISGWVWAFAELKLPVKDNMSINPNNGHKNCLTARCNHAFPADIGVNPNTPFQMICFSPADDIGQFRILAHEGKLSLLMDGKFCMHKPLVAGIGLFNIAHMPFAYMGGVIPRIPEHLGQGHLFCIQSIPCKGCLGFASSGACSIAPGHHGHPGGGTGRF